MYFEILIELCFASTIIFLFIILSPFRWNVKDKQHAGNSKNIMLYVTLDRYLLQTHYSSSLPSEHCVKGIINVNFGVVFLPTTSIWDSSLQIPTIQNITSNSHKSVDESVGQLVLVYLVTFVFCRKRGRQRCWNTASLFLLVFMKRCSKKFNRQDNGMLMAPTHI